MTSAIARFLPRYASAYVIAAGLCVPAAASAAESETVFVSIAPQKFLVDQLIGGEVEAHVLLPAGASPATYEPTPKQMAVLGTSSLFLQIGAPFEAPLLRNIARLMPDLQMVDCRAGVELVPMDGDAHSHGDHYFDPHIWLDPLRMKIVASTTADALKALMPDAGPVIRRNLQELHNSLDQTHQKVASILAPFADDSILVFHPAFGYFTRRYALHQIAVEDEGKAPSARRLATVVSAFDDREVTAIFVQPQFSATAAQRVADALGCEVVTLDPLAEAYLENLEFMATRIATSLRK